MSRMPESLPLAVQMYTLRDFGSSFEERLRAVSEAGYAAVELVGTHGCTPDEMRTALDRFGLRAISSHIALDKLQYELDDTISFARAIGNDTLVMPYLTPEQRPGDAAGWTALGERLGEIGRTCRERGLQLLYHNHDFEMAELDGKLAIDWLLGATDGDHLGFEPDVAWMVRAAADPMAVLGRYVGRCPRVHVKDLAAPGQNVAEQGWVAVGRGTLDWGPLLRAARAAGAEWFIVEHDHPLDAPRALRDSFEFLARQPVVRAATARP